MRRAVLPTLLLLVATLLPGLPATAAPSTTVVVSELKTNTRPGDTDSYVELRNVAEGAVDVSGWRIEGCNGSRNTGLRATIDDGTVLDPREHYLLGAAAYDFDVPPDQSLGTSLTPDGGVIVLDAAGTRIDSVGHTTEAGCAEGTPAPQPATPDDTTAASQAVTRDADGTDTDDNAADFTLTEPSPQASDPDPVDPDPVDPVDPVDPGTPVTPATVGATVPAGDLVVEQAIEAESLLPAETTTMPARERPSCCGLIRSGDGAIRLGTNGDGTTGDSSTLALDVPADGTWELGIDWTVDPAFGIGEVRIDGEVLGEPFNSYGPALANDYRVTYPPVELTEGEHDLTFTIVGKDERSNGFSLGMDVFRLRRLPDDGRLDLTPADGAEVRGAVAVLGVSTDIGDALQLAVDGEDVDDRAAIGGDSATLLFEGGGANGLQGGSGGFRNRVEVRGQEIPLASDVTEFATDGVDIPGELLAPGVNTITIVAGENPASDCGNRDDFDVRAVRLELPDGTVLEDPAMSGTYQMGDGVCDADSPRARELDFTFTIPAPGPGGPDYDLARGYVWDTSAVADGEHTVTLRAAGPQGPAALTHTVVVDNTPPRITPTSPQQGARVKGDLLVAAEAPDATLRATLDGEPVELGSVRSTDDMVDGEHTVVFTATDSAGNTATETVVFTTVREQPDPPTLVAPADGATDVSTSPELRVTVTDPAGDPLEVTFLEASTSRPRPGAAYSGTSATAPPSGVAIDGERPLAAGEVGAARRGDGRRATTDASDAFPFQRFELQLEDESADLEQVEVTWTGRTDGAREVALFVWDVSAGAWVEVAAGRGAGDGDVTVRGPVDLATARDGDVVHVLVQGRDPFADDIEDPADEQFKDPDDYDFSLAWMTDTQYLSQGAEQGREAFAEAYRDINRWIVDNADERKIAYTFHTGDIINSQLGGGTDSERAIREFEFADETMDILEDAGMPYGVTPGNHDNDVGLNNRLYNEYFPPSRFESATATASQDYYGEPWREGDNQNHYDLFTAGGQDFIAVYLGFIAGEEEIDWANEVLAEHADRKAIFATHEYLRPSRDPRGRDGALSDENARSQGVELFEEVVLPNDNVFLTLSGHTHGVALNIKRDVGEQGRTVVEMLANYQFYEVEGERRVGHFRLLQFDVDRSEVAVNTYSPYLDDHNADEFDTSPNRDYLPEADEFSVPVDLASRTTSFATDAVGLEARTDRLIGADVADVADGDDQASTTWDGLEPETDHAWYARAADDFGGVAESDVFTFTTGAGDGPGDGGGPGGPGGPGDGGPGDGGPGGPGDGGPGDGGPGGGGPGRPGGGGPGPPGGGPGGPPDEDDGRPAPPRPGPRGPDDRDPGPGRGRGGPPSPVDPQDDGPAGGGPFALTRLAGVERAETAARISAATFDPGVDVAYVATMADFPDALTGAPLAGARGGPVLLVGADVPEPTRGELERLQPGRIAVLGGTHAVGAAVEGALADLTDGPVERLAGTTRFGTAAAVAEAYEPGVDVAFVASGAGFPDALAGGAAAAHAGAPLLLVADDESGAVPRETREALERLRPGRVVVLGGDVAVPDPVVDAVGRITGVEVGRLAGVDRYATAVAVSASFAAPGGTAFVASGADFPDALTAVPAAAAADAPMLLTSPDGVPASVAEELTRLRPTRVTVVGGEATVPAAVAGRLEEAARR